MNSIIYDEEIITPKNYMWNYYDDFTNKLEQRDCVKFALFFSEKRCSLLTVYDVTKRKILYFRATILYIELYFDK